MFDCTEDSGVIYPKNDCLPLTREEDVNLAYLTRLNELTSEQRKEIKRLLDKWDAWQEAEQYVSYCHSQPI